MTRIGEGIPPGAKAWSTRSPIPNGRYEQLDEMVALERDLRCRFSHFAKGGDAGNANAVVKSIRDDLDGLAVVMSKWLNEFDEDPADGVQ